MDRAPDSAVVASTLVEARLAFRFGMLADFEDTGDLKMSDAGWSAGLSIGECIAVAAEDRSARTGVADRSC